MSNFKLEPGSDIMENASSPFNSLFGEFLPTLLHATVEYHELAGQFCSPEQIQLLAELDRRIKQCNFLLKNIETIEQQQLPVMLDVLSAVACKQAEANQRFQASCQQIDTMWLFTESFYWVAHKVISVILANHACFEGKRLPGMPSKIAHGGVTNVRNHIIEHPFEYSNTFGLGSMWCGPVLNGGLGKDSKGNSIKDPGLFFNAIEWADTIAKVLFRASEKIREAVGPNGSN